MQRRAVSPGGLDRRAGNGEHGVVRLLPVFSLTLLAAACGGAEEPPGPLEVWPSDITLGMTVDNVKFRAPVGASGGASLTWSVMKVMKPRVTIDGDDSGATLTAEYPGADELIVKSSDGQEKKVPINVVSYPMGSVERGQAAVLRLGCAMSGCHDGSGPDYTPSRIAGFEDRDVSNWILNGKSLKTGVVIETHKWALTIEEEQDVVAYLRSLPPRGEAVKQ